MPATQTRKRGVLHRRRIIERPRLIALLDGSPARIRTLIAPAGFGKTTLAEQWVGREGRRHAWFTARPASVDVAGLALGVARSATAVVPECDVRLREHLRAVAAPAENVAVLAELLGEDLAPWPDDAWLVLDDYHELVANPDAETFVQELLSAAPIQILIASRVRPSWITARKILYGEILELNQTELAMDSTEAADVLTERHAASASGLVALAAGWPAVIGLASVSEAEVDEAGAVPDELYEFFAEEVFSSLPSEVQTGLMTLAIAPVLDRTLARELLDESCDPVCSAALDVGILVERGTQLEIHPLARAYLETEIQRQGAGGGANVEKCIVYFTERKDWDAAFDLIVRHGQVSLLEKLLEDALDDLLETARLSTLEAWCDHAANAGFDAEPAVRLARAEVALRYGRLAEAQAQAETAAAQPSAVEVRALITAGRAAHLASLEEHALGLFRRAETRATNDGARREARWGQAICYADLERPEAFALLEELSTGLRGARELVRAASHGFSAHVSGGSMRLEALDRAAQLLPAVNDPLVESSFLSVYAAGLGATARYGDARQTGAALVALAERYRLAFARPYGHCSIGIAEAGLRNWSAAGEALRQGIAGGRDTLNSHVEINSLGALLRTLAQRGAQEEALTLADECTSQPSQHASSASRVEFAASRALAYAVFDQLDEACRVLDVVRGQSRAADPMALVPLVDAIVGLKRHRAGAIDGVTDAARHVFASGAVDYLVVAYRSVPELLPVLLRGPSAKRVRGLVHRVGDADIAGAAGCPIAHAADPTAELTDREREVYDLLGEGLTNREIARLLVISETTAKRHVQNIFDKIGVRSRRAIAVQAALERAAHATSAIDETDAGADS